VADADRILDVVFFRTEGGTEPVREWLLSLPKADRKVIGEDILRGQYCWPIGKPLIGSLRNGLWEIRSRLQDRIARVIFCLDKSTMVLLHGFQKKTRKTPKSDLDLAAKRMAQLRKGE